MPFWNKKKRIPDYAELLKVGGTPKRGDYLTANLSRQLRRTWQPLGLGRQMTGAGRTSRDWDATFAYTGSNRGDFHRWLRDNIPIISAGVWAWVRLCSTALNREIRGDESSIQTADLRLSALESRILEMPYGKGSGLKRLSEGMFLELFTTGKFAGELILTEDQKGIDHFHFIDPCRVSWQQDEDGWQPFVEDESAWHGHPARGNSHSTGTGAETRPPMDTIIPLDRELFYYSTLGTDLANPLGTEPLASIPFVSEIEQLMLEDMARSNHNAGTPRLQVKITRPERLSWESDKDYVPRANSYFEDVMSQFGQLDADDNIFTWSDVDVTLIGGGGRLWDWRLNREQVIEDVVTGLKLFPWVLGRSQKATHQWVQSQFDLLMQMVEYHRQAGEALLNWICNLELALAGVDATVKHRFGSIPDPFRLDRARAAQIEFETVDAKVSRGYISKDEGARVLGYGKAASDRVTE